MDKQLVVITKDELQDLIESSVRREIANSVKPKDSTQEYLTAKEASAFLGLALQTIYGLTSRKEIPYYKSGKKIRFIKEELINWLKQGKQPVKAKPEVKIRT